MYIDEQSVKQMYFLCERYLWWLVNKRMPSVLLNPVGIAVVGDSLNIFDLVRGEG